MAQKNGNGVRHPPRGGIDEEPSRALAAPAPMSLERGALLYTDRYTEMHAAYHRDLGREVAVLRLRPEYAQDEVLRERLRRAAEVLRRVRHPSVIRLHEYAAGSEAEGPCLLLERVQGPTLEAFRKDWGPLPAPLVLSLGRILGRALKAVHDHGVIHRDIHPGHVLLDQERRRLVLTGFLFALPALTDDAQELTRDGEAVGTPGSMAPEQARGEGVDEHVDVFALGILLYELLTGRRPFAGDTLEEYLTSVARQDYVSPDEVDERVPPCLVEVIEGWLRSDPCERLSLDEGLQLLERGLEEYLCDDAEVEFGQFLQDPEAYLDRLPGRMAAVFVHMAFVAAEAGRRRDAVREVEQALLWRPKDAQLEGLLHALATARKEELPGLRAGFVPPRAEAPAAALVVHRASRSAPGAQERPPKSGGRRWHREMAAALAVVLATGIVGGVAYVRRRPEMLAQKILASVQGPMRPGPVQFTHRLLSEYRSYPVDPAGQASQPRMRLDLDALEDLQKTGDLHAACSAWVADGSPGTLERAQVCLDELAPRTEERGIVKLAVTPSSHPDVDSDRAAILLLLGKPEEALWLIAGVLAARPAHQAAEWNRALAFQALGATAMAAAAFERIEGGGIPGWSGEASERKVALLRADGERRRAYEDLMARGRAMVAGGAVPLDLVRTLSGYLRFFLYDAVRAATSAEQVRRLEPLAEALDQHYGGHVLGNYVRRIAQASFDRRASLAETYRRLAADYNALGAAGEEAYLARLRAAGTEDLLLGALILTGRVRDHLEEYRELAGRSGDSWFLLIAENEQANAEMARGEYSEAEARLRGVLVASERDRLSYRYLRAEFSLVRLYIARLSLAAAEAHAKTGLALARKLGDWAAETDFLGELFEIAQFRNARPLAAAYLEETGRREPENCRRQRFVHEARALMHLFDLRFEEARREIEAAPLCGEPRTLTSLYVRADLDRVGIPVEAPAQLREELAVLRQRHLKPGDQAFIEYVEGMLLTKHDPGEGRQHLQKAIALTKEMPSLDAKALEARIHASEELSLAAGKAGNATGALLPLAEVAGISLPAQCVLGAVAYGERSLVVLRDSAGASHLRYEGHRMSPNIDIKELVPSDFKSALSSCDRIDVLASPVLRGRAELLPGTYHWATRTQHTAPPIPAQCKDHQLEVRDANPPSDLRLPRFSTGSSELPSNSDRTVLSGDEATPEAVLAAMPRATAILVAAQAFATDGAASLLLSPGKEKHTLDMDDLQRGELPCAPLVALILTPAEGTMLAPQEPRHQAEILLQRGARALFSVRGPVPGSEYHQFFGMLFGQIQAGVPAAKALRDTRTRWGMDNPQSLWIDGIVLFE